MKLLQRLENWLSSATGATATLFLVVMMLATTVDATLRFFFNRPIAGVFEVAEIAMVVLVFFGLGWTQQDHKHIRATMLIERLPRRAQHLFDALAWAACALFLVVLAAPASKAALESFAMREFRWGVVQMPIWWVKIILAVGLWLGALQMVYHLAGSLRAFLLPGAADTDRNGPSATPPQH
ncbi:MAG: TRAP transporter small permease [Xanthomonadaceae bacterium]|nr:TRAP transporter small permease [Xanthomonadaceae bacterium]